MILALLLAAQAQSVAVLEFRHKVPEAQRIDAAYLSDQVRAAVKELLPQARVITRENMLVHRPLHRRGPGGERRAVAIWYAV